MAINGATLLLLTLKKEKVSDIRFQWWETLLPFLWMNSSAQNWDIVSMALLHTFHNEGQGQLFLEWRIDQCNEKSSGRKIKMGTHFFFI